MEELASLPYLDKFLHETLRLYPPRDDPVLCCGPRELQCLRYSLEAHSVSGDLECTLGDAVKLTRAVELDVKVFRTEGF